ncbi:MAG: phosphatidate cytidylyltransferase [Thermoanaerobaculia bacterium]|nr:phosphatidate cytidylyltransferase [Thermoanaerobaculia bacterium]
MKRIATALLGVPLALAAVFLLPTLPFLAVLLVAIGWAAVEFGQLMAVKTPNAPLWLLPVMLPATALATYYVLLPTSSVHASAMVLAGGLLLTLGLGVLILASGTPVDEAPVALGILAFGLPYFSLPIAALAILQWRDPWLVLLLVGVVWLSDTAAYYVGSSFGRHKLAPRISPNKSWEGSIAGLMTALAAGAGWSLYRLDAVEPRLILVVGVTGIVAQMGDLLESYFKRSVGIKDSGTILPGHGGMLDRLDALLLSAPTFFTGLLMIEHSGIRL